MSTEPQSNDDNEAYLDTLGFGGDYLPKQAEPFAASTMIRLGRISRLAAEIPASDPEHQERWLRIAESSLDIATVLSRKIQPAYLIRQADRALKITARAERSSRSPKPAVQEQSQTQEAEEPGTENAVSALARSIDPNRINTLTPAHMRVFELLGQGFGNREIAVQIGITIGTVKTHCREIYDRLGINRGQIPVFIAVAQKAGLYEGQFDTTDQDAKRAAAAKNRSDAAKAAYRRRMAADGHASFDEAAIAAAHEKMRTPKEPIWKSDTHTQARDFLQYLMTLRKQKGAPETYAKNEDIVFAIDKPEALQPLVDAGIISSEQIRGGNADLTTVLLAFIYKKYKSPLTDDVRRDEAVGMLRDMAAAHVLLNTQM